MLFDLVPLFLSDFNGSLLGLAAGAATVLLARMHERDHGRLRLDGVLFACKGTLAAALATSGYFSDQGARAAPLIGMGTDLSQGFLQAGGDGGRLEPASASVAMVPILVLNSEQDGHVGSQGARRALDDWSCSSQEVQDYGAEGSRSTRREAVWYDLKAWCGEGANPGHKWYANALACEQGEGEGRRQYAALKDDILSRIAAFL